MAEKRDIANRTLADLEAVIERGLKTFVEVGQALMEIRDNDLYKETHTTFEGYCRERWGFARRTAYHYIDAAKIGQIIAGDQNVPHGAHSLPENERQVRELKPLMDDPEEVRELWAALNSTSGKPTARDIRLAVGLRQAKAPTSGETSQESQRLRAMSRYRIIIMLMSEAALFNPNEMVPCLGIVEIEKLNKQLSRFEPWMAQLRRALLKHKLSGGDHGEESESET